MPPDLLTCSQMAGRIQRRHKKLPVPVTKHRVWRTVNLLGLTPAFRVQPTAAQLARGNRGGATMFFTPEQERLVVAMLRRGNLRKGEAKAAAEAILARVRVRVKRSLLRASATRPGTQGTTCPIPS